jgi:hypothetical protein
VYAGERVATHQFPVFTGDLGNLVLSDQAVTAHERRRSNQPPPSSPGCILRITPEGIVIAVGVGDVPERVGPGA